MKKLFPLFVALSLLMGCRTFSPLSVKIDKAPISPKLYSLEQRVGDISNSVVPAFNTSDMKLFAQEVEENLTDPYSDKYGTITFKRSARSKSSLIYPVVSGILLMIPNIFGFPAGKIKYEVEVELRIFDSNNKMIGKYLGSGKSRMFMALYYGYGITGVYKLDTEAYNEAFAQIRPQIQADAERLNAKLLEAGKMK